MAAQENRGRGPVDVWTVPEAMLPMGPASAPSGRSPLQHLQEVFAAHTAAESETVAAYQRLAETSHDPVVALLMHLVVDDEARHHDLLNRMAARLRATLDWVTVPGALPTGGEIDAAAARESIAALQGYIRQEEEGARHLRRLAAEYRDMYSGLFALLLETMAMDSEKHAHLLRYLLRRAQQAAR